MVERAEGAPARVPTVQMNRQRSVIKLLVTDSDGCVAEPDAPSDLDGFARLRRYAVDEGAIHHSGRRPAVSVCSGRSYPYVEAMTQALDLRTPVAFESWRWEI